MTQEEKAKAYDKAIEKIKYVMEHGVQPVLNKEDLQDIFPELKESEDERMRSQTLKVLNYYKNEEKSEGRIPTEINECIAWLEKQCDKDKLIQELGKYKVKYTQEVLEKHLGNQSEQKPNPCDGCINRKGCINCENGELRETEQKSTNNVEPKFKVGDWITDGYIYGQITNIDDNYPCYKIQETTGGIYSSIPFKLQDNYHLWTIEDAKYGDVLTYKNDDVEWILIYKYIIEESLDVLPAVLKYHALFTGTDFYDSGIAGMISENYASRFTPATKEQRDLLFQKMHEAGYEWDSEKKELMKIEKQGEKPTLRERYENIAKSEWFKKTHEGMSVSNDEEPKWTEEDDRIRKELLESFKYQQRESRTDKEWLNGIKLSEVVAWLEKQAPNPKWSNEDEENFNDLDIVLFEYKDLPKEKYWKMIDWLKSIKQRMEEQQ